MGADSEHGRAGPKERSPNYPSSTLTEALSWVQSIWDREKRTAVSPEVLARALGYKGISGPSRQAIAALRQYGLLQKVGGHLRLSDLAIQIIHQPEQSEERTKALRTAALNPPLVREFAATHAEASDEALRAHLITRKQFSEEGARRFIAAFRDALKLANLPTSGYNDSEMVNTPEATSFTPSAESGGSRQPQGRLKVTTFSWPLSKGLTAEVRFIGDDVNAAHLERLRQYLELAKVAVASDGPDENH